MRLIHCSDIHLDSKMESNFTPQQAQLRNHEICLSFERMVQFAQNNSVNAILLCGDLFDTDRISRTILDFLLDTIRHFPRIQFLYLRGNHDEYSSWIDLEIPQNLCFFSNKWQYYRCNDLVIAGIEFDNDNAHRLYETLSLDPNDKNIVMMHGEISSDCGVDKINLSLLSGKNIDYLALGHIHSYQINKLDHRGVYCYSGALEGRGFDEIGNKGFVLLDIQNHSIQSQFIDFASRHFHKIRFDITKHTKVSEILRQIRNLCSNISQADLIQITLYGHNASGSPIDAKFLENMLSSEFYYVKINDETVLHIETAQTEHQISLRNEFIKSVKTDTTLSNSDMNTILQMGLSAIAGEELII